MGELGVNYITIQIGQLAGILLKNCVDVVTIKLEWISYLNHNINSDWYGAMNVALNI